jgi:hypothetical protein
MLLGIGGVVLMGHSIIRIISTIIFSIIIVICFSISCVQVTNNPVVPQQDDSTYQPQENDTYSPSYSDPTLEIEYVTSPVSPGHNATLNVSTNPGARCEITVYYKSGPSQAQGLDPKTADSSGHVSWTWKVGTRTTPGEWKIVVDSTYEGKTVTRSVYFIVD